MSTFFPKSENSFMKINGVGQTKFEKYGDTFLNIIQEYCQEFKIEEKNKEDKTQYKLKSENPEHKVDAPKITLTLEKIREEYPKAYEKWTELDDKLLELSFQMDQNINELARFLQRKPGAVRSRLKKIGMIK